MKKGLLILLGITGAAIWTTVIVLFFLVPSESLQVEDHGMAVTFEQPLNEKKLDAHFSKTIQQPAEGTVKTVLGTNRISEKWVEDLSKDGKLSIDTLLDELNIKN
ncbi:hypothetical protein Q7A53_00250 [Halobacillus rhizosphaerae]|uniref:hypothetical protein n=1 Tax=Halobacillus rhizosphaerae TaxID=3064889 RepID=UPI00398A91A1